MSCEGCHLSGKGQDAALTAAIDNARNYAKQNQTSVAVYKEGNDYHFIDAQQAIQQGYPIIQILSKYQ
jgi:hypothetical protein